MKMSRSYLNFDTHVHSRFSADGISILEEYTDLVDRGVLDGIGFAEHVDLMPECGSYKFMDPDQYIREVEALRSKGYAFFAGGEVDYAHRVEAEIFEHLDRYSYAYTIFSVHMIDGMSVSNSTDLPAIAASDRGRVIELVEKYYRELKHGLEATRFDVVGHVGVYRRYLNRAVLEDPGMKLLVDEAEDEIARLCAGSDKILEVNSSGLFSPYAATLPDEVFLRRYFRYGGRTVSVGSDAHSVQNAGRGLGETYKLLHQVGFRYVTLPWDRENPISVDG